MVADTSNDSAPVRRCFPTAPWNRTQRQYPHIAWPRHRNDCCGKVPAEVPLGTCTSRAGGAALADLPDYRRGTRIGGSVMATDGMVGMGIQNWCDAPQIHPSQIRVGDIIGTVKPTNLRYTVKLISGPQTSPGQWTFFGRDDEGLQRTGTFGDDDLVRRYAKVS